MENSSVYSLENRSETEATDLDVAIIGAGFGGVCAGAKLLERGRRNFAIFEKAHEVGGTWRDNTYPGCACDVPAHLYSLSFAPNPDWSRAFARQPEIQRYLIDTVEALGLRPFIRFGREIVSLVFDEAAGRWTLTDAEGRVATARAVIAAPGPLSRPSYPKIDGLETFAGEQFHSAHWNHGYDFAGKTVAVIGTGASAIQFIPEIAPEVARLDVYQRTPAWVFPKPDPVFSEKTKDRFRRFPWLREGYRRFIYAFLEWRALGFGRYPKLLTLMQRLAQRHLDQSVADPELRAKLQPDYMVGCKRITISEDYYPALQRPNVHLITEPIDAVTQTGVTTADGSERPVDCIILGTGFDAVKPLDGMTIRGRSGRRLEEEWEPGPEAYYGITVSGYPNFFLLAGPNTGLGHNSIVFMLESQVAYVLDALVRLDAAEADWMDVRPEVQAAFNEKTQAQLARSVWQTGKCKSWYQTESGKNVTLWPGFTFEYRAKVAKANPADYEFGRAEPVRRAAE